MVDFASIISLLGQGFVELLKAPFQKLEIWWYLFPILTLWLILEIYFGEHKSEKMGWNTALGNGFSLTWVTIESMRVLFEMQYSNFFFRFMVIFLALSYGVFIIYVAFTHKFEEKVTFALTGTTPTYFLSATMILWAHNTFTLTIWTLIDLVILLGIFIVISIILKKLLPSKSSGGDHEYEKFGFDDKSSSSSSSSSSFEDSAFGSSSSETNDSSSSGGAMDFLNFK